MTDPKQMADMDILRKIERMKTRAVASGKNGYASVFAEAAREIVRLRAAKLPNTAGAECYLLGGTTTTVVTATTTAAMRDWWRRITGRVWQASEHNDRPPTRAVQERQECD